MSDGESLYDRIGENISEALSHEPDLAGEIDERNGWTEPDAEMGAALLSDPDSLMRFLDWLLIGSADASGPVRRMLFGRALKNPRLIAARVVALVSSIRPELTYGLSQSQLSRAMRMHQQRMSDTRRKLKRDFKFKPAPAIKGRPKG